MSEPVTNVEIEDVLSSIRKLVSDGDKARTRDPAPETESASTTEESIADQIEEAEARHAEQKPEKLVLTPALMVVDQSPRPKDVEQKEVASEDNTGQEEPAAEASASEDGVEDEPVEATSETSEQGGDTDTEEDEGPVQLTEIVWDADTPSDNTADETPVGERRFSDRSALVATIAELEAAIATGSQDFEPDGSEVKAETIEWPGPASNSFEQAETGQESSFEDADPVEADAIEDAAESFEISEVPELEDNDKAFEFAESAEDATEAKFADADRQVEDAELVETPSDSDVYGDDDLDELLENGTAGLDDEALRALVAEVVREELTGPLGERITRNVRKLVRREIYRILSSQEFD